ncbi:MAG TPA: hypothetical protein P5133_09325 [Spirochaetia bacterium]|nr:hypothetical protein [Spirochaetia bacterium]HRZ65117.1 hypothetical protein [Spirochaetia bacterium]
MDRIKEAQELQDPQAQRGGDAPAIKQPCGKAFDMEMARLEDSDEPCSAGEG